jgi:DUF1680 family protein
MNPLRLPASCLLAVLAVALARAAIAVPDRVAPAVPDRQAMQSPEAVQISGWLGRRIAGNESNRLVQIDTSRLLEGYHHRPGRQDWDGEHIGKWLHAATLAWVNTGDPALRTKLDAAAADLAECQLDDGYLGTYLPAQRWTSWDVWSHKYNLIGLMTYVRYTGKQEPLVTCRRMADLLCRTFGDGPGQRDIIPAGEHVGLAPTSVLEPMALLYRLTGERRYLEFCRYLLRAWEQPNGPKVISTLLTAKRVDRVGNGKAYELLSCLNGLAELYRTTGEPELLQACLNAWQDVHEHRLYLTGAASYRELFRDDFDLPNTNNVGETCVTVTWVQLNAQLLRLTGEARFAEELERTCLNQLLGAQSPDCSAWGYYVQLQGRKPYSTSLTGHCCLSSGPRGLALIPTFAVTTDREGVVVNLYSRGSARLRTADGAEVALRLDTDYPANGRIWISVAPAQAAEFALKLRVPAWSSLAQVRVNGRAETPVRDDRGYACVQRRWQRDDVVEFELPLGPRVTRGTHSNAGHVAFWYGPLVLAADDALLPSAVSNLAAVSISDSVSQTDVVEAASAESAGANALTFRVRALARQTDGRQVTHAPVTIGLRPFAEAGGTGSRYEVWLPVGPVREPNVLLEGTGLCSGAAPEVDDPRLVNDGDPFTLATLSRPGPVAPQWFGVALPRPVVIREVSFMHGMSWTEGGWFDTHEQRPLLQAQRTPGGAWETLGEFASYPATTSTDGAAILRQQTLDLHATVAEASRLMAGQTFTLRLPRPETVCAVRVVGLPSRGRSPDTATLKCAELRAYAE